MWTRAERWVAVVVAVLFACSVCFAVDAKDAKFVGSKKTKTYHTPDCAAAKKIKEDNKVFFESEEEAQKAEFKACKKCVGAEKKEPEKAGEAKTEDKGEKKDEKKSENKTENK